MYDGLPITLVCVVHNDVCYVCVLGLAMVYGELQRMRSDDLVDGCCRMWKARNLSSRPIMSVG